MSQSSEGDAGPNFVIWGTNVVVSKCKQKFKRFIEEFVEESPAEDEISEGIDRTLPLYIQKLEEVRKITYTAKLLIILRIIEFFCVRFVS